MTVKEIMRERGVATVRPDDNMGVAIQVMLWWRVRHLPVVFEGEVVGVLTERDVLRRSAEVGPNAARSESVQTAMTMPAITIDADKPVVTAAWLMAGRRLGLFAGHGWRAADWHHHRDRPGPAPIRGRSAKRVRARAPMRRRPVGMRRVGFKVPGAWSATTPCLSRSIWSLPPVMARWAPGCASIVA